MRGARPVLTWKDDRSLGDQIDRAPHPCLFGRLTRRRDVISNALSQALRAAQSYSPHAAGPRGDPLLLQGLAAHSVARRSRFLASRRPWPPSANGRRG